MEHDRSLRNGPLEVAYGRQLYPHGVYTGLAKTAKGFSCSATPYIGIEQFKQQVVHSIKNPTIVIYHRIWVLLCKLVYSMYICINIMPFQHSYMNTAYLTNGYGLTFDNHGIT